MKKVISIVLAVMCVSSACAFAGSDKDWQGGVARPKQSMYLTVPAYMHDNDMILSCDAAILEEAIPGEVIPIKVNGTPVMLRQKITHLWFSHTHIFGEPAQYSIGIINLDDTASVRFINCKSSWISR